MKRALLLLTSLILVLAACGSPPPGAGTEESPQQPAATEAGGGPAQPTEEAVVVEIKPTPTPKPPPPTPTARPTATPTNTPEPVAEGETPEPTPTPEGPVFRGGPMVEIPAGPFTMGADDSEPNEGPAHEVDLPAYLIDQFEVTNADFAVFIEDSGYAAEGDWQSKFGDGKENHPVVKVTFNDATAYCEWAGKRLPTEAEWEKAAQGPDGLRFPWGNEYDESKFNGKASGLRGTVAVGSFGEGVSGYEVFDMAGNVWEWVDAPYIGYPNSTFEDPQYSPEFRVTRGGGWFDEEAQVKTTNRSGSVVALANDDVGFRCAADVE
ncbi:MAG: formylglycine-generating enzyme family protein [Anaerolineae bacterium]